MALLVLVIFGVAYGLLALVNHYLFRSYAYDLGIYNQALWDYAHLRLNTNSVMRYNNLLGDHFTLVQLLYAPLYYLFGSYTLVVVQIGLVLGGGYGAWRLHLLRTQGRQPGAAIGLLVLFLSTWGIYSALAFDYHDNVLAAMLLPWLLYWLEADRRGRATVVAGLIAASKENMALWLVFIALGLALLHWRTPARRYWALAVAGGAAVYFLVVVKLIIPALGSGDAYLYQTQYIAVGRSTGEAIQTLLTRPGYVLELLFKNHLPNPNGSLVKAELHAMVLLSGGLALLRRPTYLFMLAPIYGQKLLSGNISHWGINAQYSVEFVPVLHAALSHWLATGAAPRRAQWLATGAATLALAATIVSMQVRKAPGFNKAAAQFFRGRHYQRGFNAGAVHQGLALVPAGARVSATTPLVSHLAARPYIYQFPYVADADYIVALRAKSTYPLTLPGLDAQLNEYQTNGHWRVLLEQPPLRILQRIRPLPEPSRRFFARRAEGGADSTRGPGARQ
ncbi:DUF2079 domain-containing protein [Hymenobacter glacialis]|uniref:Glycosyltransferase RgtA/B/C/D-like domain-containing protein n=1 Tax=Hymenobacter glacialis TaxID=1908236 RepID=A0A1G1TBY6_9BACT|nr:DUF2079 domain-containing protein [Hymenobacter glacialis]OGX88389.1 hypothetical protein BEN48_09900 [Hymenobacter glacialis]